MSASNFSLGRFPVEILQIITAFVTSDELHRLIYTGDKNLIARFESGGVTEFHMEVTEKLPRNGVVFWPTLAHRFKRLRRISINLNIYEQGIKVPISSPRPDLLPPTLEEIFFRFVQAESCFMRFPPVPKHVHPHQLPDDEDAELGTYTDSESDREEEEDAQFSDEKGDMHSYAYVKQRMHNLIDEAPAAPKMCIYPQRKYSKDVWNDDGCFGWTKKFPRLRVLTLLGRPAFNMSHLDNMPSNIEHLTLLSDKLTRNWHNSDGKISKLTYLRLARRLTTMPEPRPFLTHLRATALSQPISLLPCLQTLQLEVAQWTWDLGLLPASLTSLEVSLRNATNISAVIDSIRGLKAPSASEMATSSSSVKLLPQWPRHLASITLSGVLWPSFWPESLESLLDSSCRGITRSNITSLPRKLKSLVIKNMIEFAQRDSNNWDIEYIKDLPNTITCLSVPSSGAAQRVEKNPRASGAQNRIRNRVWCTEEALLGFSTLPHLTNLSILSSLSPQTLAMLPATLKTLSCGLILLLPSESPPSKKFKLGSPTEDIPWFGELKWPPLLTDLRCMMGDLPEKRLLLDRHFALSLPRQLVKLQIFRGPLHTSFLEALPPGLTSLAGHMSLYGMPSPLLTHLLPRTLTTLNLPAAAFLHQESLVLLPKSLIECSLLYPTSVPASQNHLLPPSFTLRTGLIDCKPAFDLPDHPSSAKS